MQLLFVLGRVVFVVFFVFAGAQRLLDIAGTASIIAGKFAVPSVLVGATTYVENAIGMSTPQMLAILAGALELGAGVLLALNIGVRVMAALLIFFTAVGIFYINDFWNMTGEARASNMAQAIMNLSLIGGLLVFVALGSSRLVESEGASDI